MNLSEIAQALGVSPASVSIVRNGRPGVSPATRRRIELLLEENCISYIPFSQPAPSLANRRASPGGRNIRLVKYHHSSLLIDKNEGFVDDIIDAVEKTARAEGYTLVYSSIAQQEYDGFLKMLEEDHCSGLLVIATEMTQKEISRLSGVSMPVVVLDSDHPGLAITTVTMNNRDLAYSAVACLQSLGEVGYLCSRIPTGNFISRANGYHEALRAFSLPDRDDLIFPLLPSLDGARMDMLALLDEGRRVPKAFFADNDVVAIGAMRAMQGRGLQIPDDVQIIAVDNTALSLVVSPALSTTNISRVDLGETAIQRLIAQINDPQLKPVHIRVHTQLILRESTRLPG